MRVLLPKPTVGPSSRVPPVSQDAKSRKTTRPLCVYRGTAVPHTASRSPLNCTSPAPRSAIGDWKQKCGLFCVKRYTAQRHEFQRYLSRSNRISLSEFSFNFNSLTDACCLFLFRLTKHYLFMMMTAVGWDRVITKRNRYACSPLLVTCVILRRLTTPCRWQDMELLFGRHGAQLSKMFWEGIDQMLETRVGLITGPIRSSFICNREPV